MSKEAEIHESTDRLAWAQYRKPGLNMGCGLDAHKDLRTKDSENPVKYDFYEKK